MEGSLGVKDLRLFNYLFLSKWRRRYLVEGESLWPKALVANCGTSIGSNPVLPCCQSRGLGSFW